MRRGNIEPAINKWCDSLNLDYVSPDDTRREEVVGTYGSSKPGSMIVDIVFSANWVKDVKGDGCPGRIRGTEPKLCKKAMYDVLDSCGGKDGMDEKSPRYGGSQQSDEQCVIYKIEINDVGTS
jgi:hypothetical protein